jgi:hypothetical protein
MQTTTAGGQPAEKPTAGSPPTLGGGPRQLASPPAAEPIREGAVVADPLSREAGREARRQDLLHRARAEDVLHWQQHQRPISAGTLRKRLGVGTGTARSLVTQLRTDTHSALDAQADPTAP